MRIHNTGLNVQAHANIPPGYAVGRLQSLEPAENHESVSRGTLVIEVWNSRVPTFAIICISSSLELCPRK